MCSPPRDTLHSHSATGQVTQWVRGVWLRNGVTYGLFDMVFTPDPLDRLEWRAWRGESCYRHSRMPVYFTLRSLPLWLHSLIWTEMETETVLISYHCLTQVFESKEISLKYSTVWNTSWSVGIFLRTGVVGTGTRKRRQAEGNFTSSKRVLLTSKISCMRTPSVFEFCSYSSLLAYVPGTDHYELQKKGIVIVNYFHNQVDCSWRSQ